MTIIVVTETNKSVHTSSNTNAKVKHPVTDIVIVQKSECPIQMSPRQLKNKIDFISASKINHVAMTMCRVHEHQ